MNGSTDLALVPLLWVTPRHPSVERRPAPCQVAITTVDDVLALWLQRCDEALLDGAGERGVAPEAGAVVDADGLVFLNETVEGLGVGKRDFAHRDADERMDPAFQVDAGAVWQRGARGVVGFGGGRGGFFGADHGIQLSVGSFQVSAGGILK